MKCSPAQLHAFDRLTLIGRSSALHGKACADWLGDDRVFTFSFQSEPDTEETQQPHARRLVEIDVAPAQGFDHKPDSGNADPLVNVGPDMPVNLSGIRQFSAGLSSLVVRAIPSCTLRGD